MHGFALIPYIEATTATNKRLKIIIMKARTYFYDVETETKTIEVEARNRTQAAWKVRQMGYKVCSVNMVG